MSQAEEMWPFKFALPFVGAIIERRVGDKKQLLLQTRWNPKRDPRYSGTLEFPGGILDRKFESVFDTLEREIKEETGLVLKEIVQGSRDPDTSTGKDDATSGFQPFYCTQQLQGDYPWIGCIFVCRVEDGELSAQAGETKQPRWRDYQEVKELVATDPNTFFGLQLPAWNYYFANRSEAE